MMAWHRRIAIVLLSICIVAAGSPIQAVQHCPMASKMQAQQMAAGMKDCPDCAEKSGNQEQHKNKCCGDVGCAVNCSSIMGMNMPTEVNTVLMPVTQSADAFHPSNDVVTSFFTQSQERPPKHLA